MEWLNEQLAGVCDATMASKLCDDLYNNDLYLLIMEICIAVSLVMAFIFYKLIDSPSFQRWYHWLIILIINFFINLTIGLCIPQFNFVDLGHSFIDYLQAGIGDALFSIVFFVLWSLLVLKRFSKNCRTTPF